MAEEMWERWKGPKKTRQHLSCQWSECTRRRRRSSTSCFVLTPTWAQWNLSLRWVTKGWNCLAVSVKTQTKDAFWNQDFICSHSSVKIREWCETFLYTVVGISGIWLKKTSLRGNMFWVDINLGISCTPLKVSAWAYAHWFRVLTCVLSGSDPHRLQNVLHKHTNLEVSSCNNNTQSWHPWVKK